MFVSVLPTSYVNATLTMASSISDVSLEGGSSPVLLFARLILSSKCAIACLRFSCCEWMVLILSCVFFVSAVYDEKGVNHPTNSFYSSTTMLTDRFTASPIFVNRVEYSMTSFPKSLFCCSAAALACSVCLCNSSIR